MANNDVQNCVNEDNCDKNNLQLNNYSKEDFSALISIVKEYHVDFIKQSIKDVKPENTAFNRRSKIKPKEVFANKDFSGLFPVNPYDEVYPSIYLGDKQLARNKEELEMLGITHIVNTAQGQSFTMIDTNQAYYADTGIKFHGIQANDVQTFSLLEHFDGAAEFIDDALKNLGVVYVHCHQGFSRSATVTMAFLMLKRNLRLSDAIKTVRCKRAVFPNDGFIKQLIVLDNLLSAKI